MRIPGALLVLVTTILLAACGSDDGGDDGSGGSAGSAGASSGGSAGSSGGAGTTSSGGSAGSSSPQCPNIVGQCQTADGSSCREYGGTRGSETLPGLEENCKQAQNTWASGACTRTGAIGTCAFDSGAGAPCSAIVFYAPSDVQTAQSSCEGSQGVWSTP